jgi:hypothetical protein
VPKTSKPCPFMHQSSADSGWEIVGPVTLNGVPQHSHVVPNGDTKRHQLDPTCWCIPIEEVEYTGIFIHNSADKREVYETGHKRPN